MSKVDSHESLILALFDQGLSDPQDAANSLLDDLYDSGLNAGWAQLAFIELCDSCDADFLKLYYPEALEVKKMCEDGLAELRANPGLTD